MSSVPTARYRLCLLGQWELTGPDGNRVRSVLAQPKRLCLLAYLAMRAEPVTRSSVVALFWPSADESRGRNALSQALHHLRRSLGPGVIESVEGDRIHVSRNSVGFDARELLDGEAGPRAPDEVGEFFEGWNADDSQPLQEWVDQTRRRIQEAAAEGAPPRVRTDTAGRRERGTSGSGHPPEREQRGDAPVPSVSEAPSAPPRARVSRRDWLYVAAASVGLVSVVGVLSPWTLTPPPAGGPAVVVLAPRVMHGDAEVDLSEAALHAELVNQLVERLGPGRVLPISFADNTQEFHRLLEAQADVPPAYVVVETLVRVDGTAARLTATLLDPGSYGSVGGTTSGDFVLEKGGDGLIAGPHSIASAITDRFAPLIEARN